MSQSRPHATHDEEAGDTGHGKTGHSHTANANVRQLTIALALTSTFLVAEVIGGLVFKSLALLSDAAHMFTDVVALAIALAAIKIGARKADDRRTFGYRRFEILAAAFNAILLFAVALYVLVEGARRLFEPAAVESTGMLIVAGIGLAVNLISMRILAGGKDKSLNVKGAYLEVWADMVGSIGVIGAAIAIRLTGWVWIDPIVAIAIGFWVLPRTWVLLRDSTNILLEGAPSSVALAALRKTIGDTPGVAGLHDLHVWVSGADQPSCTAHVVLAPGADGEAVRRAVAATLATDFDVHHVTIQTETAPCDTQAELHA